MSSSGDVLRRQPSGWLPSEGPALRRLGEYLIQSGFLKDASDFHPVRQSALTIVSRCVPFSSGNATRTGLVVGCVQSGKTLSMASVASAAVDNGCRLVIVLAGTKRNLLEQSAGRFKTDLRGDGRYTDTWVMLDSTERLDSPTSRRRFYDSLQDWSDDFVDEEDKSPVFWTVMKHHSHLAALQNILSSHDLSGVPTLIIDDEADQAGLNTTPGEDDASTTFAAIRDLRACLPHHTYLQYTATPQAPLLISLADLLSPDFAEVLEPGNGYTGGPTFFAEGSPYVRIIPAEDLCTPGSPPPSPPDSLLAALRYFFVGTAVSYLLDKTTKRSMLIHPSRLTDDHQVYLQFVETVKKEWATLIRMSEFDPARQDLVDELREVYDEFAGRIDEIPPFDLRFLKTFALLLGRRSIAQEVNAQAEDVDWTAAVAHILVGGEKLNRGYTVENLSVTWMPRDAGGWNADTIQQRARFFGYKKQYLEFCRVYLHHDVFEALHDYVQHELDIRRQLKDHAGRPLNDWKRAFFMDRRSRPTRANVLSDPYFRSTGGEWFVQQRPHGQPASANGRGAHKLKKLGEFGRFARADQHAVLRAPLAKVRDVLVDWSVQGHADIVGFFSVQCWLADILDENPEAACTVILMNNGNPRTRGLDSRDSIKLFEGRRASKHGYGGDATVHEPNEVTLQLHTLKIEGADAFAVAVRVPESLRGSAVVVQPATI